GRVVGYWREKLRAPIDRLLKLAADEAPRVRLEAVRAASFFKEPEALEILLVSQEKPTDRYIDLVRGESMRALKPYVDQAVREGRKVAFKTPAGARYFLRTVSTADLLKMERNQAVYTELIVRPGVTDEYRREALTGLTKLEKKPELEVLVSAIAAHDEKEASDESVAFDLARLMGAKPAADLAKVRTGLSKLATSGR